MYWLMSLDAVLRIAVAMALLFVVVPLLAGHRRHDETALAWFFRNLGAGIILLTLAGQLLSLARLFSILTLIAIAVVIVVVGRAAARGVPPWTLVRQSAERAFLATLNIFDRRVNVPRRIRRRMRRVRTSIRERLATREARLTFAGWVTITIVAAGFRLYRPLVSANLGYSDTYGHLYLLKLLEDGRQVDPAWGPYPRGMHFLLLAIHRLTNVDQILLMNFFGVFAGVLITLAVADAARRLAKSTVAGLVAGFLFATLVGGAGQYFVIGGAFDSDDAATGRQAAAAPYASMPGSGEYDIALTAFQRQTSTLSQELSIALLFPAALFLLAFLGRRKTVPTAAEGGRLYTDPNLLGFALCTAAMAAIHPGVLVALAIMVIVMLAIERAMVRRVLITSAVAIAIGSTWMLAFIAYPRIGGRSAASVESSVGNTAYYYFPFLRELAGIDSGSDARTFVALTPLLVVAILAAIGLIVFAFVRRDAARGWIAAVFLLFTLIHFASMLGLPQVVEMRRNAQWLLMSMIVLLAVAIGAVAELVRARLRFRVPALAALLVLLIGWTSRVPLLADPAIHGRIVNYSGYGASALAVLRIERSLEPFTWTIVSYGQEFPMVMHRGFHLPAIDFLERYDPTGAALEIPTPHVFIIVEKEAHRFQVNTWAERFSRADVEQRLQTWVHLYQATHRDMKVFLEDENVRVYHLERRRAR
jgi:hypothetical protein